MIHPYSPMLNVCKSDKSNAGIYGYFNKINSGNGSYYEAYRTSFTMSKMHISTDNKLFTTAPRIPIFKKSQLSYNPMSGIYKNRSLDVRISHNSSTDYSRFIKVIIEIRNFFKSKIGVLFTQFYQ